MHMSDALLSPSVAIAAGVAAAAMVVVAAKQVKDSRRTDIVPLMGVMGAFVFAAQMVNFAIPGTGSSGHIVGGVLLAAVLGPSAAFLTLASVIIIQCLVFADGGLMALGCNLLNMGAMSTLVAYPLIYRPVAGNGANAWRVAAGAVAACIVGLELGALAVVVETKLSGVTALPWNNFILFMLPIHLAIGLVEGIATAVVLMYVRRVRPGLLMPGHSDKSAGRASRLLVAFAVAAVLTGGGLAFLASKNPDGLEWSIASVTGGAELPESEDIVAKKARSVQDNTALMPDYDNTLSGIVGSVLVLGLVWGGTVLLKRRKH